MDTLLSLKDTTLHAAQKTFVETCSSDLGLPKDTFTYNAVAIESPGTERGVVHFVVSASNSTLTWIRCSKQTQGSSIIVLKTVIGAHKGITCLQSLAPFFSSKSTSTALMTAGRDGLVKLWDATAGSIFMEFSTPNGQPVSAIAHLTSVNKTNLFAAGTELFEANPPGDVAVYIWSMPVDIDPKKMSQYKAPILTIADSHTDTITNLAFHASLPPMPNSASELSSENFNTVHLLSSSTDGLIYITDPHIPEEEDAVLIALNNRSAVQHMQQFTEANTSLMKAGHVCAISQDEKFSVHAVEEGDPETSRSDPLPIDLRDELRCDYVLGLLERQGGGPTVLAVGAFKEETTSTPHVLLYTFTSEPRPSEKPDLQSVIRLKGGHGDELVRDVWFHDDCPFILTCGEDGKVRLWEEQVQAKVGKHEKTPKKSKGKGDSRYKPY